MHFLLLGATGRVGQRILAQALQDGHEVTAVVRSTQKVTLRSDRLTLLQGDACSAGDLGARHDRRARGRGRELPWHRWRHGADRGDAPAHRGDESCRREPRGHRRHSRHPAEPGASRVCCALRRRTRGAPRRARPRSTARRGRCSPRRDCVGPLCVQRICPTARRRVSSARSATSCRTAARPSPSATPRRSPTASRWKARTSAAAWGWRISAQRAFQCLTS